MLEIQYVSDESGQPTAVIVPIELWREIRVGKGDCLSVKVYEALEKLSPFGDIILNQPSYFGTFPVFNIDDGHNFSTTHSFHTGAAGALCRLYGREKISRCEKDDPVFARHQLHQVLFDLAGVFLSGQPQPLRQTA